MKLLTMTLLALLCSCGKREPVVAAKSQIAAHWESDTVDKYIYKSSWSLVSDRGEVLGDVRLSQFDVYWTAFVGGRFCGHGDGRFKTVEQAKACVEERRTK